VFPAGLEVSVRGGPARITFVVVAGLLLGLHGAVRAEQPAPDQRLKQRIEALDEALEKNPPDRPRLLLERAQANLSLERFESARGDVKAALALSPAPPLYRLALAIEATISLLTGRATEAEARGRELLAHAPAAEQREAHEILALALANQRRFEEAVPHVHAAHQLGARAPVLEQILEVAWWARLRRLGWQIPLALALLLAIGLLLVWWLGNRLSRAELVALQNPTAPSPLARAYDRLLWCTLLLLFVSIPAMIIITAGGAYTVVAVLHAYFPVAELVWLARTAAVVSIALILWSVVPPPRREGPAAALFEHDQPRLYQALREVAESIGEPAVKVSLLAPDVGFAVRERGSTWRVLSGRGQRVLYLDLAALALFDVSELKAVAAHEYGHLAGRETRLTPLIARLDDYQSRLLEAVEDQGPGVIGDLRAASALNPVFWYLGLFQEVFRSVIAGHQRRRELQADRRAAEIYGGSTLGRALEKVASSALHDEPVHAALVRFRRVGLPCHDVLGWQAIARRITPAERHQEHLQALIRRPPAERDSHPPTSQRIERVRDIAGARSPESQPALELFDDPGALSRRWSQLVVRHVDGALAASGLSLPEDRELDPAVELQAAEVLMRLDLAGDAHGAMGRGPALEHAIADLSRLLGTGEPLVALLKAEASTASAAEAASAEPTTAAEVA
jgi:Zn-dependent protease with chaperone function